MSIWRWADALPPVRLDARVTLGEGETPLLPSHRLGPAAGLRRLFFKLESANPTGSYKDRFAAVAVAHLLDTARGRCLATSSGNTGAALAAYCAAAGLACELAIVEDAPWEKLRQMSACGAELYRVRGFGLDPDVTRRTFAVLAGLASAADTHLQVSAFSVSPVGMAGVQTISYELAEQAADAGAPIAHVFCPAGGGGLTLAVARGFERMRRDGRVRDVPRIECVQPVGNDTMASPLRDGLDRARAVASATRLSGLQVPTVLDGDAVIRACRSTGGTGHLVEDQEVWDAQTRLAREEGILAEPAGAVAVAAALRSAAMGRLDRDQPIVCLVTGAGFKDAAALDRAAGASECPMIELATLETRASRVPSD